MGNWFTNIMGDIADGIHSLRTGMQSAKAHIDPFDSWTNEHVGKPGAHGVEEFFGGVNWTYDNYISHPIATAALMGKVGRRSDDDPLGFSGKYFSAAEWSRAWRATKHVSPMQALALNKSEAEQAEAAPLQYYKPPAASLSPGFDALPEGEQQDILRQAGMPAVGNRFIENMRDSSMFYRYSTGVGDFALRWFGDPLVLGGKVAGATRAATTVRYRPKGGWAQADIDKLVNSSKMTKLVEFLEKNADNPQLVNNTDFAMKTIGPRMGAINALLKTPEERQLFIRTGMGDLQAKAQLEQSNKLVSARIQADENRLAATDVAYAKAHAAGLPNVMALAQKRMDQLNEAIAQDTAMVNRYHQVLDHAGEIDQIHLSRWSFARAEQRTAAQSQYLARPGRGGNVARQFSATTTPIAGKVDPATGFPAGRDVRSQFVKTRLWGVGDFFTTPVTVVRMAGNYRPTGYMAIDEGSAFDVVNMRELRGQVARIPNISNQTRQDILNQYLKTTSEGERKDLLNKVNQLGAAQVAKKHGLRPEAGLEIYKAQQMKLQGELDAMEQFSAAQLLGAASDGLPLRVDAFETSGGIKIHPHTVSRIMNSHVMPDLEEYNRILSRHASALRALRESHAGNPDWVLSAGDYLNHLWKFATLFRLGYIARAAGDDLASQLARLGPAAMALRIGYGMKNAATNLAHREQRPFLQLKEQMHLQGASYAQDELDRLVLDVQKLGGKVAAQRQVAKTAVATAQRRVDWVREQQRNLPTDAPRARIRALERMWNARIGELQTAKAKVPVAGAAKNIQLRDLQARQGTLEYYRDLSRQAAQDARDKMQMVHQGTGELKIGDTVFPAAFGGQRGDYFMQRISPTQAYDQLFRLNKDLVHANLTRSFDHGARPIEAIDDEVKHASAWAHAVNAQIAGDEMQRMLVAGTPEATVVKWLKNDAKGKAYWKRLDLPMSTPEDIVARARAEVDEYLPLPEIRMQALAPEGVSPQFLKDAVPNPNHRPTVHMANVGKNALGFHRAADRVMQKFYDIANIMPAKRLSRHPLFNQLYEGHLKQLVAQRAKQGAETKTVADVDHVVEIARRLAERDMKKLVFDISHRTDAAAALRFISPFFSATAESFQRWGRVIADRPEILGYASNFYNAPAYSGHMQDQDGNHITPDGYVWTIDPKTGRAVKKRAAKEDRFIVGRMPKWLINSPLGVALGVERSSGNVALSQNSINMVTQGDPWFNPGVGPIVQIPVNEFVKDKPDDAELARKLGVLPFGPVEGSNPFSRAAKQAAPSTVRNFITAYDTSDYRYQQVKAQILQRAVFEHEQLGKPMPSEKQIAAMTRNYWFFSAASAFLQPAATRRQDAYQYYRDQYNILRRQDPQNADQQFLQRFGEDYFIFAQAMSKNVAGIQATKNAVALSKKYAGLLAAFPELGPLIIGKEGNGPFSPEAYAYQLNAPLVPGDSEMQRTRLSAEEAMKENQRRLGWAKFSSVMDWLNAQKVQRGLATLHDQGAEDLDAIKKAFVMMLGDPTLPDGRDNPYYNAEWSQDYYSLDAKKYERLAPALETAATQVLKTDPGRADMRGLLQYLQGRKVIVQTLNASPYKTLSAKANTGLKAAWVAYVSSLTDASPDFESLFNRYLSRDLGVDMSEEEAALQTLQDQAGVTQ